MCVTNINVCWARINPFKVAVSQEQGLTQPLSELLRLLLCAKRKTWLATDEAATALDYVVCYVTMTGVL